MGHCDLYIDDMGNPKKQKYSKFEPYTTFFDFLRRDRQSVDIQSKVEELRQANQVLRERDKTRYKELTYLSDQIITLAARKQEVERSQNSLYWILILWELVKEIYILQRSYQSIFQIQSHFHLYNENSLKQHN